MNKTEEWRKRLARHAKSNLSVAEFCAKEKYSTASFYVWRSKLNAFTLVEPEQSPSLTVEIGFAKITLDENFNAALLQRVVEALS